MRQTRENVREFPHVTAGLADLPAGLPAWMRSRAWADRRGDTPDLKRATVVVTVPRDARPWM